MKERVWVVSGECGAYSDTSFWVESVHATREGAEAYIAEHGRIQREIQEAIGRRPEWRDVDRFRPWLDNRDRVLAEARERYGYMRGVGLDDVRLSLHEDDGTEVQP